MVDEYEEIQKLRQLWSGAIMTWNQIMIPLCAAIIAFFVTQLPEFKKIGLGFQFLLFGWILLTTIIIYYRLLVHHIDFNIVGMYPRMLELEKEKGMEIQADYYYRNLNNNSKKYLAKIAKIEINQMEKFKFRDFKEKIKEINHEETAIDLLLKNWDKFGWNSVTGRGHGIQDIGLGISSIFLLILILLGHYYYSYY